MSVESINFQDEELDFWGSILIRQKETSNIQMTNN
jgi:hypothetical protein